MYTTEYIGKKPEKFVSLDWIDIDDLKSFLGAQAHPTPATVNIPLPASPLPNPYGAPMVEEGRASVMDRENLNALSVDFQVIRSLLPPSPTSHDASSMAVASDDEMTDSELDNNDPEAGWVPSDTKWLDRNLTSDSWTNTHKVMAKLTVERIERLTGIPSIWPVPEKLTAFLIDRTKLMESGEELKDGDGNLRTIDALIKNKDQDSWASNTGKGDTSPMVVYTPGGKPIESRRARLDCKVQGGFACRNVNPVLMEGERRGMSTESRDAIRRAQGHDRQNAGSSAEALAIESPGHPDATYAVVCTHAGTKKDHMYFALPSEIDPKIFARVFARCTVSAEDIPSCATIVSPSTGRKGKCRYPHIIDGQTHEYKIKQYKCKAKRTIYLPKDPSIRLALVYNHAEHAHSHPMPVFRKLDYETKAVFKGCIKAFGVVGATVPKVDLGKLFFSASTKLKLNGLTPGKFSTALNSNTTKRKIIRETKLEEFPDGVDLKGASRLFHDDQLKSINEKYYHRLIRTVHGKFFMVGAFKDLLEIANDAGVKSVA
ncbi:unnamed protein product [Mycena citricolor]|uniref:Uncharacterized protein n=1 Tax=Mycena citricolor TaxID=2018698 RepID=A0AAD2JWC3_9AGAR|nr:unnamed protein product [Mycena citricolor]